MFHLKKPLVWMLLVFLSFSLISENVVIVKASEETVGRDGLQSVSTEGKANLENVNLSSRVEPRRGEVEGSLKLQDLL